MIELSRSELDILAMALSKIQILWPDWIGDEWKPEAEALEEKIAEYYENLEEDEDGTRL